MLSRNRLQSSPAFSSRAETRGNIRLSLSAASVASLSAAAAACWAAALTGGTLTGDIVAGCIVAGCIVAGCIVTGCTLRPACCWVGPVTVGVFCLAGGTTGLGGVLRCAEPRLAGLRSGFAPTPVLRGLVAFSACVLVSCCGRVAVVTSSTITAIRSGTTRCRCDGTTGDGIGSTGFAGGRA